jgi:NADPH-dependent curcumin reductase
MATGTVNRSFRLGSRPEGLPSRDNFRLEDEPLAEPGDGEVLVRVLYISLDPAMRGWMADTPSYVPPVQIGEVMRALGVGRVIASRDERFAEGDHVSGVLGVQEHALVPAGGLIKIDPGLAPLPTYLGVLGMTGMTAYFGLLDVGRPEAGETVVVSAAAGAVGALVGQIAKLKGCRAVGIAGGPEKCAYVVDELGFDAAIDYKGENVQARLAEECPDRIHVYFDNVGGPILDAALARLAMRARVVLCGAISRYNSTEPWGPTNYMSLLVNRASMTGFIVFDFAHRYGEAVQEIAGWLREGKVKAREDVVEGFEAFPEALLKLYTGENFGKLVLKVGE